jgi:hypothetical protein
LVTRFWPVTKPLPRSWVRMGEPPETMRRRLAERVAAVAPRCV